MTTRTAVLEIAVALEEVGKRIKSDEPDKAAAALAGLAAAVATTYDA